MNSSANARHTRLNVRTELATGTNMRRVAQTRFLVADTMTGTVESAVRLETASRSIAKVALALDCQWVGANTSSMSFVDSVLLDDGAVQCALARTVDTTETSFTFAHTADGTTQAFGLPTNSMATAMVWTGKSRIVNNVGWTLHNFCASCDIRSVAGVHSGIRRNGRSEYGQLQEA